ncbi:MAG: hypothetical protein ABI234_19235 [Ktedonobacteraceae bacterium]
MIIIYEHILCKSNKTPTPPQDADQRRLYYGYEILPEGESIT